ncbi:hypothetical protein T4C_12786 [Trichinella pseudospiralis]|uniref:Uncharacterized protein n=1 Tax=Trichinella pseudospiralis TaxID=6337 RepID=A0A0V1JTJ9_TRIPS|nr:hypothetical protein T4C_12786 [Trichinella pseudospiralis]
MGLLFKFFKFFKHFLTKRKCNGTISRCSNTYVTCNDDCIRHVHPASSAFFCLSILGRPVFTKLLVLLHHLTFDSKMPVIWSEMRKLFNNGT